jgi:hypothetical protein
MRAIFLISLFVWPSFALHAQTTDDSAGNSWSGSAAAYYYFIPGEKIPPTITVLADHNALHLESRYNYEDINSLSVFAGWNFEKQFNQLDISVTPMAGVAMGHTNGILPGLELTASYKRFTLYSENEYMLDFKGRENHFFYSWTQFSGQIFKNTQAGILAQSLRWYQTKFDVQRGLYAEYNTGSFTFDVYYFNPLTDFNFVIVSASFGF